jgi:hypothetical protein
VGASRVVALEVHQGSAVTALALADTAAVPQKPVADAPDGAEEMPTSARGAGGLEGGRWLVMSADEAGILYFTALSVVAAPAAAAGGGGGSGSSGGGAAPAFRLLTRSRGVSLLAHGGGAATHLAVAPTDAVEAPGAGPPDAPPPLVVVVGTASGAILVFDASTAACLFLLAGHTAAVTALLPLRMHLQLQLRGTAGAGAGDEGDERPVVLSCGADRRLILLEFFDAPVDAPAPLPTPDGDGDGNDDGVALETAAAAAAVGGATRKALRAMVLGHADSRRSADGPLTALAAVRLRHDAGDDTVLASASAGGRVSLWGLDAAWAGASEPSFDPLSEPSLTPLSGPLRTVYPSSQLEGHTDRVTALRWLVAHGQEATLLSSSLDGTVRLWSVALQPRRPAVVDGGNGGGDGGYAVRCVRVLQLFPHPAAGVLHAHVHVRVHPSAAADASLVAVSVRGEVRVFRHTTSNGESIQR